MTKTMGFQSPFVVGVVFTNSLLAHSETSVRADPRHVDPLAESVGGWNEVNSVNGTSTRARLSNAMTESHAVSNA
jgi:hypothetical protein